MDFLTWLKENEDFDGIPGYEDDHAGQEKYDFQQQRMNQSVTFSPEEVQQVRQILSSDAYGVPPMINTKNVTPALLSKLKVLGIA